MCHTFCPIDFYSNPWSNNMIHRTDRALTSEAMSISQLPVELSSRTTTSSTGLTVFRLIAAMLSVLHRLAGSLEWKACQCMSIILKFVKLKFAPIDKLSLAKVILG